MTLIQSRSPRIVKQLHRKLKAKIALLSAPAHLRNGIPSWAASPKLAQLLVPADGAYARFPPNAAVSSGRQAREFPHLGNNDDFRKPLVDALGC